MTVYPDAATWEAMRDAARDRRLDDLEAMCRRFPGACDMVWRDDLMDFGGVPFGPSVITRIRTGDPSGIRMLDAGYLLGDWAVRRKEQVA